MRGLGLEKHRFAPELNRLTYKGVTFKAAGCTTIKEAYEKLFSHCPFRLYATIQTVYDAPQFKHLERKYSGRISHRKDALRFAKELRLLNQGGETLAGYLPPLKTKITIRMVGA